MILDLILATILWATSFLLFGRFIAPRWKAGGKLAFYLAVTALLSYLVGHWSLIWVIAHPLVGVGGHIWWCGRHEINWLTCQPRDKDLALRPWANEDGFARKTST